MKGSKIFLPLVGIVLLSMTGCTPNEDRTFHMIRCTMAASVSTQYEPSIVVKSWEITGLYMRENGIKRTQTELTAITDSVREEIIGPPDSLTAELDRQSERDP